MKVFSFHNQFTFVTYRSYLWHFVARLIDFLDVVGACASKNDEIQKRVGTKSIGSVHGHTGCFARRPQSRNNLVLTSVLLNRNNLQPKVAWILRTIAVQTQCIQSVPVPSSWWEYHPCCSEQLEELGSDHE